MTYAKVFIFDMMFEDNDAKFNVLKKKNGGNVYEKDVVNRNSYEKGDSRNRMKENRKALHTERNTEKNALIENIIALEWAAFDKVDNEGGRADCQDDFKTFSIMRKSQYRTWTKEMIQSFIEDFENANKKEINLIAQKYGYMMESTAPDRFAAIKEQLMPVSEEKRAIRFCLQNY